VPRARKPKKPVESPRLPKTFDRPGLAKTYSTYARPNGLYGWEYPRLIAARDAQVRGMFREPVALARSLRTDPAVFAALLNRQAPHRGLSREIRSGHELQGTASSILAEARATFIPDTSSSLPPGLLADAFDRLALHEIGIDQIHWEPRPDGSRLDAFVTSFPLECVEWDECGERLLAITTEGRIPIVHGDGRWIVYTKSSDRPWAKASLVALAGVWCDIAYARRDRSKNVESHGESKWIGTLGPGIDTDSAAGDAFYNELIKLYDYRRAMVKPYGSEVERSEAAGTNWQIFGAIIDGDTKDIQRILLGQDGTMTNSGGDYIKSWGAFGVRQDIVESDLAAVGACLSTGLLRPWSLMNFGRWDRLEYKWLIPDSDEDTRRASIAERRKALWEDITLARSNGALVDQDYVDELAAQFGVVAPRLAQAVPSNDAADAAPAPAAPNVSAHRFPLRAAVAAG
jgi:hypothetical protein